jgi:transposase
MLNLDQFMNIRFLQKQGHSVREIARMTGHSRNTVRKLLRAKRAPPVTESLSPLQKSTPIESLRLRILG